MTVEWGWIVAAILFGWITKRAEQAAAEQLDTERTIRMTALDPEPWDAGAVVAILPELADDARDRLVEAARRLAKRDHGRIPDQPPCALIRKAMIARDLSDKGVTRKSSASMIARQANAAAGGPLMTPDELDDEIGL